MIAIFKRELNSYFTNMTGYVFAAFLMFIAGLYAMMIMFKNQYASFQYVVSNISFFYLLAIPILTMKSMAEEKKQKTDQLLYSLPISMTKVVVGKFLAMLVVLLLPLLEIALMPLIGKLYGNVPLAISYSSLFGYFMMGAALTAAGLFLSSLTENQIVAAVLCFIFNLVSYLMTGLCSYLPSTAIASFLAFTVIVILVSALLYFMTKSYIVTGAFFVAAEAALAILYVVKSSVYEGLLYNVLIQFSLFSRMDNFYNGIFDLTSIFYYLSVSFLFLFFTVQIMEKRRWS